MADIELEMDVETYIKEKYPEALPLDLIPGRISRFDIEKRDNKAGWAIVFPDGNGFVGDWRTGEKVRCFPNKSNTKDTNSMVRTVSQIISTESNEYCKSFYDTLQDASPNHKYLMTKRVGVAKGVKKYKESLVIPGYDGQNNMVTLQYIFSDGKKRFRKGTSPKGAYFVIGDVQKDMYMAEGYATAFSIHKATGKSVIMAFNAGNLYYASKSFLSIYPDTKITIVADNDNPSEGHVMGIGEEKARETGLDVILIPSKGMDANDYLNSGRNLKSFLEKRPVGELDLTFDYDLNKDLFPPDWLIKGWIAKGSIVVIFGAPSSGKSSIALDMFLSYSTSQEYWHGYEICRHEGICVYLCGEGYSGLVSRKELWLQMHDVVPIEQFIFSKKIIPLDEAGLTKTISELRKLNRQIDMIVIDTFRKAFKGDENSSGDTENFLENCKKLSEEFEDAAIVIIAHSGKTVDAKSPRGSSNLIANPDYAVMVTRDQKTNRITLSQTKAKDSEEITCLPLLMKKEHINRQGEGKEITSVIITDAEEGFFLPKKDLTKEGFKIFSEIWTGRYEDGYPFITKDEFINYYIKEKNLERSSARNYLKRERNPFASLFERSQMLQLEEGFQLMDMSLVEMLYKEKEENGQ